MTDKIGLEMKLSGSSLAGIMQDVINKGAAFRFRAKGHSMAPFIRNEDILTISPVDYHTLRPGDVAAVIRQTAHTLIVHRVVKTTGEGILLKGDNCPSSDGFFPSDSLVGMVTNIERNGHTVQLPNGFAGRAIAFLSRTSMLTTLILPPLRKLKKLLE